MGRCDIPKINIMGVNIAAINMEWLINFTNKNIYKLKHQYICVSNVHTTVMAYENSEYKNIQNSAILAIPDGGPLSSVGRKRGCSNMSRTVGQDYMKEMFKGNYKHFFYGSTDGTLNKMRSNLIKNYPNIEIVGMYSPPYRKLTSNEDNEIIDIINKTNPDFVWVGLGAPKQENWMYDHKEKINSLMVGVGAAFDYLADNIKRAPRWMQKRNLEWLYRLIQEPKRLFKRYFVTNTKFIWEAVIKGK